MQNDAVSHSHRYFTIDSNLNSADVTVVLCALNDLSDLLPQLADGSIINSALLRLVNLMSIVSNYYIKNKIGLVLATNSKLCQQALNRSEIVNSLMNELHASDRLTRLIYLRSIAALATLFKSEVSTYHHLLTRLTESADNKQEQRAVYRSLKNILAGSRDLSKIFLNGLTANLSNPRMPQKVLIRLCCFLCLNNRDQHKLVECIWRVVCRDSTPINHQCLAVVLEKAVTCNPAAAELYIREIHAQLSIAAPRKENIWLLVLKYHPFLPGLEAATTELHAQRTNKLQQLLQSLAESLSLQTVEWVLDFLYDAKQLRMTRPVGLTEYVTDFVKSKLQSAKIQDQELEAVLLCCYYLPDSWDEQFASRLTGHTSIRLLKILMVLRYHRSATVLLENLLNSEREFTEYLRLIFYRSVLNVYRQANTNTLTEMLELASYKGQATATNKLSTFYRNYYAVLTEQWHQQRTPSTLNELNQQFELLTGCYPQLKPRLQWMIDLLQRSVFEHLSSAPQHVDWYRGQALRYLPDYVVCQSNSVREVLMLGIYFWKEAL